jgi:2-octaprenyl-6-methoxyphenol hydroxylase
MLQIAASRQDYAQSAIITNIRPGQTHNNVAYERFTDTGPLAFLPMTRSAGKQRCSVVWTVPSDQAEALMQHDDASFLAALQQRFGYRLGRLQQLGKRQVYPLALVETTQLVRGRVVVVGNAAHSIHPVAGQGFNLALRDIALLAELLGQTEDAGDAALLESYVSARQEDAQRVYRFTDTLVKLFSNHFSPLAHARAAGLLTVDLLPSLKHALARQSMGLGGNLSRLGRGLTAHREQA